jgi:catechol 2,3-dioxygenase-like lactoylglutathione lyase family enzyme
MKIQGFNHLTIAVRDLTQSLAFYTDVLGASLSHRGRRDAYLELGNAWICLLERPEWPQSTAPEHLGVHHVAFYIPRDSFDDAVAELKQASIEIVRRPIQRGTGWSVNFLDPDGTQLELHTATLGDRLRVWT